MFFDVRQTRSWIKIIQWFKYIHYEIPPRIIHCSGNKLYQIIQKVAQNKNFKSLMIYKHLKPSFLLNTTSLFCRLMIFPNILDIRIILLQNLDILIFFLLPKLSKIHKGLQNRQHWPNNQESNLKWQSPMSFIWLFLLIITTMVNQCKHLN